MIRVINVTVITYFMPTISVSEDVKRELLKFASELQMKLGKRVDFDEAIRFLLMYRKRKNPRLLIEACTSGDVESALKELYEERKIDERRYSRYLSD
jgi:predicted CopG family antitoxin